MGRLNGRKALITGAGSGIGAATARLFAAEGAKVALLDRDAAALRGIATQCNAFSATVDVSDEAAVNKAVDGAVAALGGLDALVNAAGIASMKTAEETSLELWRSILDINLTGVFLVCRAAMGHLRTGSDATIVNIASASALLPSIAGAAYGVSKAGVDMLSKYLARELAPSIRVNSVCPGMVDTPMMSAMLPADTATVEANLKATYALQRVAKPQEIADAILFLTSRESAYITGISMAVDGGRTFH
jgi:NAD(P)-dependent dehydrogenase (short-subunit alcohol dehydrogenase family)